MLFKFNKLLCQILQLKTMNYGTKFLPGLEVYNFNLFSIIADVKILYSNFKIKKSFISVKTIKKKPCFIETVLSFSVILI